MKNLFLLLFIFIFLCNLDGISQDSLLTLSPKNELKLNVLNTFLLVPEISYERIIRRHNSIGFSGFYGLPNNVFSQSWGVVPFFRIYFGEKKINNGLFFETNISLNQIFKTIIESDNSNISIYKIYKTEFGLGFSIGYKYVLKQKTTFELNCGFGRYLTENSNSSNLYYPRVGVNIGRRF